MKTRILLGFALLALAVTGICGCAGTVRSTPTEATAPAAPAVSTALLIVGTQGNLPPDRNIGGIDVTLNLPPGVTAKADKTSETMPGVVVTSGVAQGVQSVAKYTPAADGAPAQVRLVLLKLDGFGTGEFATVHLDINGQAPLEKDFSAANVTISDTNGKTINGLTTTLALQVK